MKRFLTVVLALIFSSAVIGCAQRAASGPYGPIASPVAGPFALDAAAAGQRNPHIRNIIIMIPDGTPQSASTLARWYKAYNPVNSEIDPAVRLHLDDYASGLVRTWWRNAETVGMITDSAPAATAMATGVKTDDNFIGMTFESTPRASILEGARSIGKSTGLVATSNIQHATPAAFSAHHNDRGRFDIIGEQQVYNAIDVVFGGGSQFLQPPYRQDGQNIIDSIRAMGYQYITTRDEMLALNSGRVWGMFAANAMAYDFDRPETAPDEPSLAEMTAKAIELLNKNSSGFFLMVEGSKIDWAAHANDPTGVISDTLAFDAAFKVAVDFAKASQDTMILIVADHGTGGISIGNMQTAGPGFPSTYSFDPVHKFISPLRRARLTGEGISTKINEERSNIVEAVSQWFGIDDLSDDEIETIRAANPRQLNNIAGPMISRRAYIGWTTSGHTAEEMNLFSYFPGGSRLSGTIENTDIARISAGIWGIDLDSLSARLFVEAQSAFAAKGAGVDIDTAVRAAGTMTVSKGDTVIVIPENKNYVVVNGERITINSVIVNQSGVFYVPVEVIDLIR